SAVLPKGPSVTATADAADDPPNRRLAAHVEIVVNAVEDEDYVSWLRRESMLADASRIAGQFSGIGSVWQSPCANPDPEAAVGKSSEWFPAYPISMITKSDHSFLGTLADEDLWRAFEAIGIKA